MILNCSSSSLSRKDKIYKAQNNGIIASSRNIGAEVSKGNFLAFLDSDDWWEKDKLKKSHQALLPLKVILVIIIVL